MGLLLYFRITINYNVKLLLFSSLFVCCFYIMQNDIRYRNHFCIIPTNHKKYDL